MRKQIALLFTLLTFLGCRNQACEINPEIAARKVHIPLDRLEKPFYQARSQADIQLFLLKNPDFAHQYLQTGQYPSQQATVSALWKLASEPNLKAFAGQVQQTFGEMADVNQELENAFKHLQHYYPAAPVPQVKTFISGMLGPDLYVSDSLVVLGIDYFAGPGAPYRPQQPAYILQRYQKPFMVPAVMLQLSAKYNKTDARNRSMLAQMVDFGKSFYFTQRMMPCAPDSLIIGYTAQQMADIQYNEGKIWAHFIEKSLLYETNHFKVNKYIGERPTIPEISKRCPGRIATWLGWQMVRKYMAENPQVSLQQLMQETDAQKIFQQSRYKPKSR
ncbi:MAG: gliding motility lipoprotein GldB [Adhaeribacter sp.]